MYVYSAQNYGTAQLTLSLSQFLNVMPLVPQCMPTCSRAYLRNVVPMPSTKIALYIFYLLIISLGIHVYVYYMILQNYSRKLFKKSFLGRSHMGALGAKTSQWRPFQVAPRARALLAIP